MKIKCTKCGFANLENSSFCQDCGFEMGGQAKKARTQNIEESKKNLHKHIEEIDDVIFKPKKKGSAIGRLFKLFLIAVGIGIVGIIILALLAFSQTDNSYNTPETVSDKPVVPDTFPVGYLSIEDLDSDWVGQQFYVKGILKNSYNYGAKNVVVRVDFYKDKAQQQLFDTRYVTIVGVPKSGAYSFTEPVYINPYDGQFWFVLTADSAEILK